MDAFTRRQLEQAVKFGDEDQVRDLAGTLWRARDGMELRDIIKDNATRCEYFEAGTSLYYDGLEIDRSGRIWIDRTGWS
jgi:hypothetical protein